MGMNTNNLGLSTVANGQLERMIDDAAWLTYPLHVLVGILRTFVYTFLFIGIMTFAFFIWMFTAHDDRATLTKDFATQENVYHVDPLNGTAILYRAGDKESMPYLAHNANVDPKEVFGLPHTYIKNASWFDGTPQAWLADKSDAFDTAYVRGAYNLDALRMKVYREKGEAMGWPADYRFDSIVIPNAPVLYMSFMQHTDAELSSPANAYYNWFTGMCLASAKCTDADFVPRNDSIWYDLIAPQMTVNQNAAVNVLYATGSPEFWVAAAHANGIYGKDADFAKAAVDYKTGLDRNLKHDMPSQTAFSFQIMFFVGLYVAFVVLLCAVFQPPHINSYEN
jgi:hypothetical protein